MSDPKVITMVVCPYCDKEWVREDDELVCDKCENALKVDLAIASTVAAVDDLSNLPMPEVRARIDLLLSVHNKLTKLIQKAKPKPRKK